MKYLLIILLFTSCGVGNYTLCTNYGAFRNYNTEELTYLTLILDTTVAYETHSFILYQRRFIGRYPLMHMIDTIPGMYYAEDWEGYTYAGRDYAFIREFIKNEKSADL